MIIESILSIIFTLIIYNNTDDIPIPGLNTKDDQDIHINIQYIAFILVMGYIIAGWTEESNKYYWINRLIKRATYSNHLIVYILIGISTALGFANIENYGYISMLCTATNTI